MAAQVRVVSTSRESDNGVVSVRDELTTASGSDGRFEIRLPVAPDLAVMASLPGHKSSLVPLTDFASLDKALRLGRGPEFDGTLVLRETVSGRVLMKAGGPAAGATVRISPSTGGNEREFLTDSQGRYEIPVTPLSKIRIQAFLSGMAPASTGDILVPREGEAFPDLILSPGKTVTGRVLDETSAPLQDARGSGSTKRLLFHSHQGSRMS